jgi:hypothetical protein
MTSTNEIIEYLSTRLRKPRSDFTANQHFDILNMDVSEYPTLENITVNQTMYIQRANAE